MSASSDTAVAVIVGAGEGTRMRTQTRKQYLMLGDRPVLAHTLAVFEACEVIEEIFLVIPEGDDLLCQKEIVDPLRPSKPIHLLSGGVTRQESVYRGSRAYPCHTGRWIHDLRHGGRHKRTHRSCTGSPTSHGEYDFFRL